MEMILCIAKEKYSQLVHYEKKVIFEEYNWK